MQNRVETDDGSEERKSPRIGGEGHQDEGRGRRERRRWGEFIISPSQEL